LKVRQISRLEVKKGPEIFQMGKNSLQLTFYVPRQFAGSQVGRERESFAGS
jgi:hypothetical protein